LNQTAPHLMTQELDKKTVQPWASAEIFPRGQRRNFAYLFKVANDAMQMDVHKTLYSYHAISLCWLNLNLLSELFSTLRLSGIPFLFINCLISIFSSTFCK